MKKWGLLLCLLALLGAGARAEELPAQVRQQYFSWGAQESDIKAVLSIRDGGGNEWYLIADRFGSLNGYIFTDGAWRCWWSGSLLFSAEDTAFSPDGEGGFFIRSAERDAFLRYAPRDSGFSLVSWRDGRAWPGTVEVSETLAVFRPDGDAPEERVAIDAHLYSWLSDFDALPKTPRDMRERAALCLSPVSALMPQWRLGYYELYNYATACDAAFFRVENGCLSLCRVTVESGRGVVAQRESLSVPLSPALIARMDTEPIETLLDFDGLGSLFLTPDAWDASLAPISGKILQNDLQESALIALTEENGARYIALAWPDESGAWQIRRSQPLPLNASLDLWHTDDGEIQPQWSQGGVNFQCEFDRDGDGNWLLSWLSADTEEQSMSFSARWYGLWRSDNYAGEQHYAYGTLRGLDLFSMDFSAAPASQADALSFLDTEGWAAVRNPDPRDRLHLRAAPNRAADSLGKFYNGTPVQVLEIRGDWCRVRVGRGQSLEGWMMKQYLAFGGALADCAQAFPDLSLRDEYRGRPLSPAPGQSPSPVLTGFSLDVIGILEGKDAYYIVMDMDGNVGYLPADWLWAGNG